MTLAWEDFFEKSQLEERHQGVRGGQQLHKKNEVISQRKRNSRSQVHLECFSICSEFENIGQKEGKETRFCCIAQEMCGNVFLTGGFNYRSFLSFSYGCITFPHSPDEWINKYPMWKVIYCFPYVFIRIFVVASDRNPIPK